MLVLDAADRILLFRFEHKQGVLAGQVFWATPGGRLDDGETFEHAAVREAFEETGLVIENPGPQVARRVASFTLPTGELVEADERYFLVRNSDGIVCNANWTEVERNVMVAYRWWSQADLQTTADQVWPETLNDILINANVWTAL